MNKLRQAFVYMTRNTDMKSVLVKSAFITGAALFFSLPYFHFHTLAVMDKKLFQQTFNYHGFLFSQLFMLFVLCFLCALIGFSFSKRLETPGIGDWQKLIQSFWNLLAIGLGIIFLSYFLFDRFLIKIAPHAYPREYMYLLALPFKRAFADEIILRMGLLTISILLFKSKLFGVVAVSLLFPLLTVKYFDFIGVPAGLNYLFMIQLVLSFAAHLIAGYLFITQGLIFAMMFDFILGLKYFIIIWIH